MAPHDRRGRNAQQGLCRREFMLATAAGGALLAGTGLSSAQSEIRLDGERSGWIGRAPSVVEDETNPTLALEAGQEYEVTWTNTDGATHTFAIEDDTGDVVVGPTDRLSEEDETQTVAFTAEPEMAAYYCSIHPQSMRGAIDVGDGEGQPTEITDVRRVSVRDFAGENYEILHAYRKRRAIEVLLSDPEVNDVASEMISSFEAYDPHTGGVDAVSVQGAPEIEIEGGVEEGAFDVTVPDRQVAYGLVDRGRDELLALTLTEPQDVSWRAWEGEGLEADRLRLIRDASAVRNLLDEEDWYPLYVDPPPITSARGIEHGGVDPVVLIVDGSEGLAGIVVYLDVRTDEVGEVIDASRVERFVEFPPHELANDVAPEDDTVLGAVPDVPFERRPYYTANDGVHRIDKPERSFDLADWSIEWEPPDYQGVEVSASFRDSPVFDRLTAPVTFAGYDLPDRDDESTLEWFFPDADPVFAGDALSWDVHSLEFGGPGLLDVLEFPDAPGRPGGFRLWSHYYTGSRVDENQDVHSGHRFGTANYEISYDFFEDGSFVPVWSRQGPGFTTEYASPGDGTTADETDSGADGLVHHHVAGFALDVAPGGADGVDVEVFDGDEWRELTEEFYLLGEPGRIVRFANADGPEQIDLSLDDGMEVVVVRRSSGEIPERRRIDDPAAEAAFYHPAQYIGGEGIGGERIVVWLLLEAATGEVPAPAGITSFVSRAELRLSGY